MQADYFGDLLSDVSPVVPSASPATGDAGKPPARRASPVSPVVPGADDPLLETTDQRETYARLVAIDRQRRDGIVPAHYTATTHCNSCGPVPIFQGCPPEVEGCPWCLVGGPPPAEQCPHCGGRDFWNLGGERKCPRCHPDPRAKQ